MIAVALLRHAPTTWNVEHRLQGRTDIPISDDGRSLAATWRLPPEISNFEAWASRSPARARPRRCSASRPGSTIA